MGATGEAVSSYGLGTWTWGHETDDEIARAQLFSFLEVGGTLIDTAGTYSGGQAEHILGGLLRVKSRRESVFLCTKAGVSGTGLNTRPGFLLNQLHDSLRRLSTDYVDLWQLHAWSDQTSLRSSFQALRSALDAGKARYVGVCNYTAGQLAEARGLASDLGIELASIQSEYSLLARGAADLAPHLTDGKVGLLAWSPLAGGILTGKYESAIPRGSRADDRRYQAYMAPHLGEASTTSMLQILQVVADAIGSSVAQAALAWVRGQPGVTSVLLGARNAAQLAHALESATFTLPHDIQTLLAEVTDLESYRGLR